MHTCIMYARKHGLWFFTHLLCTNCWVTLWYAPVDILLLLCHLTSRQRKCIHMICLCMSCGSHSQFFAVHFQLRTVRKIDSRCHNQNRCIFPAGKSGLTVVPIVPWCCQPPPPVWMHFGIGTGCVIYNSWWFDPGFVSSRNAVPVLFLITGTLFRSFSAYSCKT